MEEMERGAGGMWLKEEEVEVEEGKAADSRLSARDARWYHGGFAAAQRCAPRQQPRRAPG